MNKRTLQGLKVLAHGGYVRRALERDSNGREQFRTRFFDADHVPVRGLGFKTFADLQKDPNVPPISVKISVGGSAPATVYVMGT